MKRFVPCDFLTTQARLSGKKIMTVLGILLLTVASVSAKSVFTDNLTDAAPCTHDRPEAFSKTEAYAAIDYFALSVADITIISVTSGASSDCVDFNGNIVFNAEGNNPNLALQYSIDNGATFQAENVFMNLAPGTYNAVVSYEDGTCPTTHGEVIVNGESQPVISDISTTNISDCDADNGAIFVEAAGDGATEFSIDGGMTYTFNSFFGNLSEGTYTVFVRLNGTDCVSEPSQVTLTSPTGPQFDTATPTDLSACSAADGMLVLTASSGTNGNYEFSIDGGNSWQGSGTFAGLGAGMYMTAVRNADDDTCVDFGPEILLTAPDAPAFGNPTVDFPSSCLASDGSITVEMASGDVNNLMFSLNGIDYQDSNVFTGLAGGTYELRVRTNDQTCFVTGPTVTVPGGNEPDLSPNDFVQQITACGANDGVISVAVANDNGNFLYSIDNGLTYQTSNAFDGLSPGTYTVVVDAGDNFCTVTGDTYTLADPPAPTIANVTVNQTTVCDGTDASIVITAEGGQGDYIYSIGSGFLPFNTFNEVQPGEYTISINNAAGNCLVEGETVTVNALTTPEIQAINAVPATSCAANDGSITISGTGGSGSYQYSIDNGANWQDSDTFTGLTAGEYPLGIRNADGTCEELENSTELLGSGTATVTVEFTDPTDCGATDGTITVNAQGANTYEYSLDGINFQAENVFTGLAAGTYTATVQITDGTCPVTSDPIVLTTSEGTIDNVEQTNPNSCTEQNGSITVTATGDNLEYSIDGITFQNNGNFTGLPGGEYEVSIRNTDGTCPVFGPMITLAASDNPAVPTFNTQNPTGCNTNDGTISIIVANDNGSFQYSIDGGETFQNENFFSGLDGGEYNILVTSSTCETNGGAISLLEPEAPTVDNVEFQNPDGCDNNNGFIVVTGSGTGDLEYSIDGGLSWKFFGTFADLDAGEYTPAVRNQFNGTCPVLGEPVTLTAPGQTIITNLNPVNPTACGAADGALTVDTEGSIGDLEYSIDNGATFQTDPAFGGLGIGTYRVIVRNTDGSCETPAMFTQLSAPGTPIVEQPLVEQPSTCGANDGIIVITAEGGNGGDLQYSNDGGATFGTQNSFTGLGAGSYDILVQNADGTCTVNAGTVILNSEDSPNFSGLFTQDNLNCDDENPTGLISVSVTNDDGTFEYSNDGGATFQNGNSFENLATGSYEIVIRQAGSACEVSGGTATVGEPASPEITSVTAGATLCGEATGNIIFEVTGGVPPYEYSVDGGMTFVSSSIINNLATGTYQPVVRNANTDCETAGNEVTVDEDGTPTFSGVESTNPTTADSNDGTITINATPCGNNQLEYSIDGGVTFQTGNFFDNLPPGTYNITVRNVGSTETFGEAEIILTAPDAANCATIEEIIATDPTEVFAENGSISILIDAGAGTTLFSIDNGATFQAESTFNGLSEGTYQVVIQNDDGTCTVIGETVVLSIGGGGGATEVTITTNNPAACGASDGSITVTAPLGFQYLYSIDGIDYQMSPEFPGLGAGNYTVSALDITADQEFFFANNPVVLTVTDAPTGIIANTNPACGATDGVISVAAQGGNGTGYEYSIDGINFNDNNTFDGLAAGTYTVSIRNGDGTCTADLMPVTLTEEGGITLNGAPTVTNIGCGNDTGTIALDVTGGTNVQFSADGGVTFQPFPTFTGLAVGTYNVIAQNDDGTCQVSAGEITITDEGGTAVPDYSVSFNNPGDCGNDNGQITVTFTNENIDPTQFEYSIDGGNTYQAAQVFNDLGAGEYNVFVQNADGTCPLPYILNPVILTGGDTEIFTEMTLIVNEADLLPGGKVCVPVPVAEVFIFDLTLDGNPYNEQLAGCDNFTVYSYSTQALQQSGSTGPYNVDNWVCNNGTFSGEVADINALVAQMNVWDPTGNWILDGNEIVGGEDGAVYGDILITVTETDVQETLMVNSAPVSNGTCIAVGGVGTYEFTASNGNGCSDTITIIVEEEDVVVNPPVTGTEGDTIFLSTPQNTNTEAYCFTGENLDGMTITGIVDCGIPSNGAALLSSDPFCTTYVPGTNFLGQDEFCVVICGEGGNINCDSTVFIVTVHPPTNTVDVTVNTLETEEVCLEENVLQLPGNIQTAEVCGIDDTQIAVSFDANCVTFDPADGFFGETEVCVIHCDDSSPAPVCDTTFFNVTVTPDCPDIFTESEVTLTGFEEDFTYCVPIAQMTVIETYTVFLDEEETPVSPAPCDVDTSYVYNVSGAPAAGFTVTEWICNGATFSFVVTDVADLLDSMNVNDPAGNWTLSADNQFIEGGENGAAYSTMTVDLGDGDTTTFPFTELPVAGGSLFSFSGFGQHTIIFEDAIGCTDTITITYEEDNSDEFVNLVTPFNTTIDSICGDTTTLAGNWNGDVAYCLEATDGLTPIITGTPCVFYTPLNDFVGFDTLCLQVCDDMIPTNCNLTTFVVQVLPPVDTIEIIAPSLAFDTCLMTTDFLQLPGEVVSAEICGFDSEFVDAVSIQDTCLTIDLTGNLGLNTTEICFVHCDDNNPQFCDTTYLSITGSVECEDFIAVSDTVLVTDMGNSNICVPLLPLDIIDNYEVVLDGELYSGPIGGCDFTDIFTYDINNIFEGPYTSVTWLVDGNILSGTANDLEELAALMSSLDPTGDWTFNEDAMNIFSTNTDSGTAYGVLTVTNGSEIYTSNDTPALGQLPGGTTFVFQEPGGHVLVFTENATGCTDSISINVFDGDFTLQIETFQNVPDTTCFDITAEYPNFDSLSICGQPTNGTFEIFNDTCFIFTPNDNFLGEDEGCVEVCSTIDGVPACETFTVLINVVSDCPENLILADDIELTAEDCDVPVDYCLDLNGADLTGYTVTDNGTEIDLTLTCENGEAGGFYDFSNIPAGGFTADSVDINGETFTGTFDDAQQLIDSLNVWDIAQMWTLDADAQRLVNGSSIGIYDTLFISAAGEQFALVYTETTTSTGLALTLTSGPHQIVFTDPITTCTDVVNINVLCDDPDGCPGLDALSPTEIITEDCDTPVEFCVSLAVEDLVLYTITDNGEPYAGGAVACSENDDAAALQLLPGEHTLVFTATDGSCTEEFFVDVRCIVFEDLTIEETLNLGQSETFCLFEDYDVDTTGIIGTSVVNTCPELGTGNVTFTYDTLTHCITFDPVALGQDTICLELCNAEGCITLTFNLTVIEQCDDLFALDNVGGGLIDCDDLTLGGEICLPILREDLMTTDIFVGGVEYTGVRDVCDPVFENQIAVVNVPGGGELGPYEVTFTVTDPNGNETDFTDTIEVIGEIDDIFNAIDPAAMWVYDPILGFVLSPNTDNTYNGTITQIISGSSIGFGSEIGITPTGTAIIVPSGTQEIIFIDQETGCRDTLISTVACLETDTLNLVLDVGMSDTLCFDTLELVGNFVSISNDCPELSGTAAEVVVIGNTPEQPDSLCVSFNGLVPGEESACIIVCDDLGICDTTYVNITVRVNDLDLPVAVTDSTTTGQNQPVVINPFANDTINGFLDTFFISVQPQFGEAAFNPDGSINYVPNPDFCDAGLPDTLQYVICNTLGCDSAWIFVTVNCPGILVYTGFSPNGDGTNETWTIDGIEAFTESRLQVFNRWGNRVLNVINYQNDWDGKWEGKDLPNGTYYYILNLNDDTLSDEERDLQGWIQIRR